MKITDEDIEYVMLLAIQCETDFTAAIHALFDMKGVDDQIARETIWRHEGGRQRLGKMILTLGQ